MVSKIECELMQQIHISDQPEFPRSYVLIDLNNSENIYDVIIDAMEEDVLSLYEVEGRLSTRLGSIQISQTFVSTSVDSEETISYYKYLQPIYYEMKTKVALDLDKAFKELVDSKKRQPEIELASPTNGEDLFKQIQQQLTKIGSDAYYLTIMQKGKPKRLSRNNKSIELDLNKDSTISVKPVRGGIIQINIKPLKGNQFNVSICEETTVAELREIIDIQEKIPCDLIRIMFDKETLKDDERVLSLTLKPDSQIGCLLLNRGEYEDFSDPRFVDISKGKKMSTYPLSNQEAPMWRIVRPGLCLEGKCLNKDCEAFENYVVINVGFGIVDPAVDREKGVCPSCGQRVYVDTCGFNNCVYEFVGTKYEEEKLVAVRPGPKRVENEYRRIDLTEESTADWAILKIVARKEDEPDEVCLICKKKVTSVGSFEFACKKHKIHAKCKKAAFKNCFACAPLNEKC